MEENENKPSTEEVEKELTPDTDEQPPVEKPAEKEEAVVPVSTVEALKAAYEQKIADMTAKHKAQIDAQNEVISQVFGKNKKPVETGDLMSRLVSANNQRWARRKF